MENTDPQHDVLIIGTGFGGLGMAILLQRAGLNSFVILEKAGSVGGTWRENTYPGAACDVQSHLYSFSFEPKNDWSRRFPPQAEIRDYLEHCAAKNQLASHIHFNTEVASADFDAATGRWCVTTTDAKVFYARIVVAACGQLSRPAIPKLPGMDSFAGKSFHSAHWDHDYDLNGKTVAVIGTGASAIQFVPAIVPRVKQLRLFQRSGAWVIPKPDRAFSRLELSLLRTVPMTRLLYRAWIYCRNEVNFLGFKYIGWALEGYALRSRLNAFLKIRDKTKRKAMIPDYKIGCKRVLLSDDWFPAIDRDHVEVITQDIDHVEPQGIVTRDGQHHPVDTIIYGTGFHATEFLAPIKIHGLNGKDLNDAWRGGAEAYKGICIAGFPNFFMLYGPNTNLGHNSIVYMLESQFHYIMQCIHTLKSREGMYMSVKPKTQKDYVQNINELLKNSVWESGCTSWYRTETGRNTVNWPGFTFTYRRTTRHLNLQDFELHRASEAR